MLDVMNKFKTIVYITTLILYVSTANASTYTFDFDDIAPGDPSTINAGPYGSVTITDEGVDMLGDIDFSFTLNPAGFKDLEANFGIGKFFLNSDILTLVSGNFVNWDPSDWELITNGNTGAGPVEFTYAGTGDKTDTLEFTIRGGDDGTGDDDILNYIILNQDGYLFGAHAQAFGPGASAWIYAGPSSSPGPGEVPLPAAFWLFGTALIGFIGMSRKTKV